MKSKTQIAGVKFSALTNQAQDFSLVFRVSEDKPQHYPTDRLQKGLLLYLGNKDLSEEGVGFGVPILKFGYDTMFAGSASLIENDHNILVVDYAINLVPRMTSRVEMKPVNSEIFYRIKECFSLAHRKISLLRGVLTKGSGFLKSVLGLQTSFERVATLAVVRVSYAIDPAEHILKISVDLTHLKKNVPSEVIIANELGANKFGFYRDSNGVSLAGNAIGTWNETKAKQASLINAQDNICFTLYRVDGARMFRGRELAARRLAWAGLNYVISKPIPEKFDYVIRIGVIRIGMA